MSFFSIVIPTYNSSATINAALESILTQTFTDFEILIIDGLSTDDTILKVRQFSDSRIRVFSEKDNGVYDAMNKGIQLAIGEWLYFLGSDDLFENQFVLKKFSEYFATTSLSAVYGNVRIKGDCNWANDGDIYDGCFDLSKLLKKNICHQAVFYKMSVIKRHKIQFNCKYTVCADWDFNLRMWSISEFEYKNEVVAIFNAGGLSTRVFIDDNFIENIISKAVEYFDIKSYNSVKKIAPPEMHYQLKTISKFKWQIKLELLKEKFFKNGT